MSSTRFVSGVSFIWQEQRSRVLRQLEGNKISIENLETGVVRAVSLLELVTALFDGNLRFFVPEEKPATKNTARELNDYPKHLVEKAEFRLAIIRPLLEIEGLSRQDIESYVKEQQKKYPQESISATSIHRWKTAYLKSGGDIRSLLRKERTAHPSLLDSKVDMIIEQVIQDQLLNDSSSPGPKLPSSKELHQEIVLRLIETNSIRPVDKQLEIPSLRTVSRRVSKLDPMAVYKARYGEQATRRKFTQYGQMPLPQNPLERVEADHTSLDLIAVDEVDNLPLGRPTFTTLLDIATKYPLGVYLGFEPPSYHTVKEAMYHAILPKPDVRKLYGTEHDWQAYGLFNNLIVDNGKEFLGKDLADACSSLGIQLVHAVVKMPEFKAGVERAFRTYNSGLFHQLPGTTFSNAQERGDYNSVKQASISLSELLQIFHIYLLDIYAEDYHKGLGAVPARRWEKAVSQGFSPRLPVNRDDLYILLGRVDYRVLQHYGIEFMNLRYNLIGRNHLAVLRSRLNGQKVKIKYHADDLSRIYIFDPFEQSYIELPSLDQEYTANLSLWKHRILVREAKREEGQVDIASLGRARRRINTLVEQSRQTKSLKKNSKVARWDESGKKSKQSALDKPKASEEPPNTSNNERMKHLNDLINQVSDEGWTTGPKLSDLKKDQP